MLPNGCFLDRNEESTRFLLAIEGYEKVPLVSLEKAIEPLISIVPDIRNKTTAAKNKAQSPSDNLSPDESASICLYSMEWKPDDQSLYRKLNFALREQVRERIQPWFLFLKLFITALTRLPPKRTQVYRGVKLDLHNDYPQGKIIVWWGFNSCTRTIDVLQSENFVGTAGKRTIFNIECFSGIDISKHSYFTSENEIILLAATQLEVIACLDNGSDLHTIQLREISTASSVHASQVPRAAIDSQKLKDKIHKCKPKSDIFLFGKYLTEASMDIIVQEAIIEKQSTSLYLKETNLTSACAAVLADALYGNTTLKGLYLSINRIDDAGAQSLAKALKANNNRTLERLSLGLNPVSAEGAEHLAEMLKTNRTLKELWLSENPIGDQGIQALTKALSHFNQTLEVLSIGWNKSISASSVNALADMLTHNQSLRKLDLVCCKLSRSNKAQLRDAIKSKKNVELQT